jgi:NAD-dependent SIR2 family protein deacetylase
MAHTALNDEEIEEFFDEPDVLDEKINTLSDIIKNSKNFIVYTGAGISTSAGIPDFRGPQGVWTLQAKGIERKRTNKTEIIPTPTHMSLVSLLNAGHLKHVISTNCDGLHLKSGVSPKQLLELHGNSNVEACNKCGRCYWRPFKIQLVRGFKPRSTGRFCDDCGNKLRYTSVAFEQSMPDLCLDEAERLSKKCDVSLVIGSSMRVTPACNLPVLGAGKNKNHKLIIINLQKTPYDDSCALRIFARVDQVFDKLMKLLEVDIPNFEPLDFTTEEWLQDFKENWKFRTPGNDWFVDKE